MARRIRSRAQVKKERAALRKLISTGLLPPKTDLRKAPSKSARSAMRKYKDVLMGTAAAVKPAEPKAYEQAGFRRKGKVVIIPRRKGEKIRVNKKGEVVSDRTVRGRKVKGRMRRVKAGETIKRPKEPVQYAIPFNRGDHIEWSRHSSYDDLAAFMNRYSKNNRYKTWRNYTVSENTADREGLDFEDDEELTFILEEKLGPQYGASAGRYPGKKRRGKRRAK